MDVIFSDDPALVLHRAGEFLASEPVFHNLILTLLHARVAHPEPGRYWMALESGNMVGVILQSPPIFAANLTPMEARVARAMADAIAESGVQLPGINAEAATAASFAGEWSERCKAAITPLQGHRLYELLDLQDGPAVAGRLRQADRSDRSLVIQWMKAFEKEVGEHAHETELRADRSLTAREMWLWEDAEPVSMAVAREPVEGVVRISGVYTPAEKRRRGYAEVCVSALSKHLHDAGLRCVLYTDLGNPTSNSIYRRIGYRAVSEVLRYRFDESIVQKGRL